jgi:hypothetical protein
MFPTKENKNMEIKAAQREPIPIKNMLKAVLEASFTMSSFDLLGVKDSVMRPKTMENAGSKQP